MGRVKGLGRGKLKALVSLFILLRDRFTPFMGMVTIIMNDYPQVKTAVLAILAILVITNREN